jgi:hypothetical protein
MHTYSVPAFVPFNPKILFNVAFKSEENQPLRLLSLENWKEKSNVPEQN